MTNIKHLIHRTLDIGSGFILSILIQYIVFPFFDIYIDVSEMIHLALIFTVIGILRSYLWSKYIFKYKMLQHNKLNIYRKTMLFL